MIATLLEQLHADGLVSPESYAKIKWKQQHILISVHWEIKTLLYLGVLLLSASFSILVYKNIATIGHQVILLFIALVCSGCFFYCFKKKLPYSAGKVAAPNAFFDYVLLLGCCTFITFTGYLQFQYNFFGNRYGLALFFPMLILFFSAYYFDHLGILSMAIVNFGAWLGITVTPVGILESNDFNDARIIFTGLALGIVIMLAAWVTHKKNIKKHFEFTYANFGTHLLLISSFAAMFHYGNFYLAWFVLLIGLVYFFYRRAMHEKSFYFILINTLYAYIGISYVVINLLTQIHGADLVPIYLGFFYFIISGIALVLFLIRTNKKIKAA